MTWRSGKNAAPYLLQLHDEVRSGKTHGSLKVAVESGSA